MKNRYHCPSCYSFDIYLFYEVKCVPVHSVLLMESREKALRYPKRDISLAFCRKCGFIFNATFDPFVHDYSSEYEATQSFSPAFNAFHKKLATHLINRYGLRNKTIIEIGCGNGDFLTLLCDLGNNKGVGFDPTFKDIRKRNSRDDRIIFVKNFYSDEHNHYEADFICCKMTLEHIHDTAGFLKNIRLSIGEKPDTKIFFQVPEVRRILQEHAFWDIYYEHCSYFSHGSLARLLKSCGFDVIDLWTEYDGQYLLVTGKTGNSKDVFELSRESYLESLKNEVERFAKATAKAINRWKQKISVMTDKKQRVVIWSSSSKGVAFLTTLAIQDEIEYAVDINPYRQGSYMAGSGQKIIGPDFLRSYKPDVVVLLNPFYRSEIEWMLKERGLCPKIMMV